jgi:hypothetical protein
MATGRTLEVVRGPNLDEWCVMLNGTQIIAFGGPNAWAMAEHQREELQELLREPLPAEFGDLTPKHR